MPKAVTYGKTERMSFARHEEIQSMPNLLEIQKNSYKWFLEEGLRDVFKDVDVITDYSGNLELRFVDYAMDENPKYTEEECKARDATYAAPLKVSVRLRNKETEEIKEQEIFMGDFPIMTPSGTFVINGAERVIVSQIVRSPGVYYDKKTDKAYNSTYGTTVIPYHGAWLEYETDLNDIFNCRIDKNRKLPVTWFIKAMGAYKADNPNTWLSCIPDMTTGVVTNEQIKEVFDNDARIVATLDKDTCNSREEALVEIYRKLRPGDPPTVESSESLLEGLFYDRRRYDISNVGRYKFNKKLGLRSRIAGHMLAAPVVDPMTGEIIAEAGEVLTTERAHQLDDCGVNEALLDMDGKTIRVSTNYNIESNDPMEDDRAETILYNALHKAGFVSQANVEAFKNPDIRTGGSIISSAKVGPSVAKDITYGAIISVALALFFIFLYILLRFRNLGFSVGSIVALFFDTLTVVGIYSLCWGWMPFSLEIDQTFIGAILTVIGYQR